MTNYQPALAFREHMLDGNRTSVLEALLLFGVQNPQAELTRMRKDGLKIESTRVPMAKIIVRINRFVECSVPSDLPYRELTMTEYWISR